MSNHFSPTKMAAIILVFLVACGGWYVLGTSTAKRSKESHGRLDKAVQALWGTPIVQEAPSLCVEIPGSKQVRWVMPTRNDISVDLTADYRKKGLIWYPTYVCRFEGAYTISNEERVAQKVRIHFRFPTQQGTYDDFSASIDGTPLVSPVNAAEGVAEMVELGPGKSVDFVVTYQTRGIREWRYRLDRNAGRVRGLNLVVNTDFSRVDYPEGCLSPMSTEEPGNGRLALTWQAADLITQEGVGVIVPEKLNPGPLTSRITFFAPICLVFFFVLVATINILYKVNIHPMHYLFVAAGFFAFHLLLAYMAGLVNIHLAFVISAVVSVSLVTGYLSGALRGEFPWKVAVGGQLFFLVLFSYSFFIKGVTGLTVAIGSVITLGVLMKVTAHVNWDEVFERVPRPPAPSLPPIPSRVAPAPAHEEEEGEGEEEA